MNMHTHDVISAFIDNEEFQPAALQEALEDPAGRALLIDLVVLKGLTRRFDPARDASDVPARPRRIVRLVAVAAALVMCAFGGYQFGSRSNDPAGPPAPTRIISAGESWQPIPGGGGQ